MKKLQGNHIIAPDLFIVPVGKTGPGCPYNCSGGRGLHIIVPGDPMGPGAQETHKDHGAQGATAHGRRAGGGGRRQNHRNTYRNNKFIIVADFAINGCLEAVVLWKIPHGRWTENLPTRQIQFCEVGC